MLTGAAVTLFETRCGLLYCLVMFEASSESMKDV
jgi:hypothetical protein